jgi:hypothetical protein
MHSIPVILSHLTARPLTSAMRSVSPTTSGYRGGWSDNGKNRKNSSHQIFYRQEKGNILIIFSTNLPGAVPAGFDQGGFQTRAVLQ